MNRSCQATLPNLVIMVPGVATPFFSVDIVHVGHFVKSWLMKKETLWHTLWHTKMVPNICHKYGQYERNPRETKSSNLWTVQYSSKCLPRAIWAPFLACMLLQWRDWLPKFLPPYIWAKYDLTHEISSRIECDASHHLSSTELPRNDHTSANGKSKTTKKKWSEEETIFWKDDLNTACLFN